MKKFLSFISGLVFYYACAVAQPVQTFTNPLLPSGPDPYSFYKDGYYYYTHTLGNRIGLWKAKSLADLKTSRTYNHLYTSRRHRLLKRIVGAGNFIPAGKMVCLFCRR